MLALLGKVSSKISSFPKDMLKSRSGDKLGQQFRPISQQ